MKLEQLLSTRGLVQQTPSSSELLDRSQQISPDPLQLFYGETYDEKGNPIDSMKYYFFLALLSQSLREEGATTEPTVLVADSAACRNAGEDVRDFYMRLGADRARFIERVNNVYDTGLNVVKMSDYIDSPRFIDERRQIIEACIDNPELMALIEKTVPGSKIEIEREKGFLYSFDEITSIIDLDLKVGPPREDLYDGVARNISKTRNQPGILSLFLTPTFPLGMNWAYFFKNTGIEDHGITAYKAGSKRLQRNRVVIGASDPYYIKLLVESSFISNNPSLPNPVLDIGIICEMAKRLLSGDNSPIKLADQFYDGSISIKQLKDRVGQDVEEVILNKM